MVDIVCFPHKNRPLFPTSQLREFAANAAIMPIAISDLGGDREMRSARFHSLCDFCAGSQDVMQSHEVS